MNANDGAAALIRRIEDEFDVRELHHDSWRSASEIQITTYWSGETAPAGRHLSTRLLWSDLGLYVRFIATQTEPLVVRDLPDVSKKTLGLWDRDVCEIFVAPDRTQPNRYFEFEAAPTGEWVDIGIEITPEGRLSDWDYSSEMTAAAAVGAGQVAIAIQIPWSAFAKVPRAGDTWLGNLFRCVGKDPDRGYLAWQPTRTPQPSFHVPSAFGEFVFVNCK